MYGQKIQDLTQGGLGMSTRLVRIDCLTKNQYM
jgi:hypothetical protein